MLDRILQWDRDAFIYLNGLGVEEYDLFWSLITKITTWIPLFLLFAFLFFRRFAKKEAISKIITVLVLVLFVVTVTDLVKESVARLRPNNDPALHMLIRIVKNPVGYSFFSGHASTSFAITTLVFLFLRRHFPWSAVFFVWPMLFAISRVYLGVHFPVDIIVGAAVGTLCGWMFYTLYQRLILPYLTQARP